MTSQPTTFDDHNPLAKDILEVIEAFIDEIGDRECTGHFDTVVDGKYYLKGKHLIQVPERFIEDHLVFPVLEQALGHTLRPQPKHYAPRWPRSGIPDFCMKSIPIGVAMEHEIRLFGEVKSPKKIQNARNDMQKYLDSDLDVHAIAILSDGFEWELWVRPRNQPLSELENPYTSASLKAPLQTVRTRNMDVEPYRPHTVRNQIDVEGFSGFTREGVFDIVRNEFGIDLSL